MSVPRSSRGATARHLLLACVEDILQNASQPITLQELVDRVQVPGVADLSTLIKLIRGFLDNHRDTESHPGRFRASGTGMKRTHWMNPEHRRQNTAASACMLANRPPYSPAYQRRPIGCPRPCPAYPTFILAL